MNFLFVSNTCSSCTEVFIEFTKNYCKDLEVLTIVYNDKEDKFFAYKNDTKLEYECPVNITPSLYLEDTNEFLVGQTAIRQKLIGQINASK